MFFVPRPQTNGVEVVDAIRDAEPTHERCEPDAARYEKNRGVLAECLEHAAQPAQEFVDPMWVIILAKHSLEEDRQLVDDQEHRAALRRTIAKQLLPVTPPTSRVQSGTDLHAEIECADFLDIVGQPTLHPGDESRCYREHRVRGSSDFRDDILGTARPLDIGENKIPALSRKPPPKFPDDAGLPHATLSGQQHVVLVADQISQCLQLGFTIEEIAAAHPATG